MSPIPSNQEDIVNALENDASHSDSESSDSSKSSSDSSSFAKNEEIEADKKGKRKAAKAKPKAGAAKKAKVEDPPKNTGPRRKDTSQKEQERFQNAYNNHEKTDQLLSEVTPSSMWRSLVRAVEIERRMEKASLAISDLQKMQANSMKLEDDQIIRCSNLEKKIAESMRWIQALKESVRIVKTFEPDELAKVVADSSLKALLNKCSVELLADEVTLSDMVHTIAKKLFDANAP